MLGGASRVLEMAVEYAKERVQFGRPIGSFQAVKHRCADMLVDVEGMRSTSYWAAWCIGADDPDQSIAASTAKTWGSDASKRVMASALQVHGGIGFTWEHDLHFFLKRAQLDQLTFGDASCTAPGSPTSCGRRSRPARASSESGRGAAAVVSRSGRCRDRAASSGSVVIARLLLRAADVAGELGVERDALPLGRRQPVTSGHDAEVQHAVTSSRNHVRDRPAIGGRGRAP